MRVGHRQLMAGQKHEGRRGARGSDGRVDWGEYCCCRLVVLLADLERVLLALVAVHQMHGDDGLSGLRNNEEQRVRALPGQAAKQEDECDNVNVWQSMWQDKQGTNTSQRVAGRPVIRSIRDCGVVCYTHSNTAMDLMY